MKLSEQTNDLFSALSKAQGEIKPAELDGSNPHLKSRYASITSIKASYQEALAKHGLVLTQMVESCDSGFTLNTLLGHSSGQWMSSEFKLLLAKQDMQGLGSTLTYARRQTACAILGIVDHDDVADPNVSKDILERARGPSGTISVTNIVREIKADKTDRLKEKLDAAPPMPMNNPPPVKNYAPGAEDYKPPAGFPDPKPITNEELFSPGEYVIEFGKYKGKTLREIGKTAVQASLDWIAKDTDKSKPLARSLSNFRDYGTMFVNRD